MQGRGNQRTSKANPGQGRICLGQDPAHRALLRALLSPELPGGHCRHCPCHHLTHNHTGAYRKPLSCSFLYLNSFWLSNPNLLLIHMTHLIPIIEIGMEKKHISVPPSQFVSHV